MEDIQDLQEFNQKFNQQKEEDTKNANILIGELKQSLQKEKVTPEKQKLAADNFFKHQVMYYQGGQNSSTVMSQLMPNYQDVHVVE